MQWLSISLPDLVSKFSEALLQIRMAKVMSLKIQKHQTYRYKQLEEAV